ncbi:MAG: imidazolonepropionase [Cyclobacteriaceae bacterium]|nr:imidazolonepropionase [Cyclobacteriaceae bacterium]
MKILTGPFEQIITMNGLPLNGPAGDDRLEIIQRGGMVIENNRIIDIGGFENLRKKHTAEIEEINGSYILLPGFIDAHTHLCYAGSRSRDYAERIAGSTYREILEKGGGIYDTVDHTRRASFRELSDLTEQRIMKHFENGITTMEIKSGYGLNTVEELKMLEVIRHLDKRTPPDLVATCLAAHVVPLEFSSSEAYLTHIIQDLLPLVREKDLSGRVDIFIEKDAFSPEESFLYLSKAKKMGFDVTVHVDQFTSGGSDIAARIKAVSADHLEVIDDSHIRMLIDQDVVQTVLPGASIGLGMPFAPARKILDAGGCLAIASDWNPGSAPMGDLLTEASILSASQKLNFAETMAGVTFRAARALSLTDRGRLDIHMKADFVAFASNDYREILYQQGQLKPAIIWKNGNKHIKHT